MGIATTTGRWSLQSLVKARYVGVSSSYRPRRLLFASTTAGSAFCTLAGQCCTHALHRDTSKPLVAKILSLWRRAGTAGHRFVGCARSTNGCQLAPSSDLQARSNYDGDPLAARSARTYNTMHVHSRHPLLLLLLLLRMIRRATPPRPPPRSPARRSWRCAAGSGSGSCPTQRTKTSSETSPSRGR